MGAAMRRITSAPVPVAHRIGTSARNVVTTVIIFGRMRWTAPWWTASASSNAAAGMLMKELILLKHFGKDYPVPKPEADAWLKSTKKSELGRIFKQAMQEPLGRNGLDVAKLRQGAFFTREGKNRVPASSGSTSTAGELMKYMVQIEKGELVDAWSSREIKKLLYLTDQRIRYAASPVLDDSAVYFKSGSLYGCKPERGYECGKFLGNRINYMNSMVIIESHDRDPQIRYAVVVLSNVLRKNSSEVHQEMGAKIHRIIQGFHPERTTPPRWTRRPQPTESSLACGSLRAPFGACLLSAAIRETAGARQIQLS